MLTAPHVRLTDVSLPLSGVVSCIIALLLWHCESRHPSLIVTVPRYLLGEYGKLLICLIVSPSKKLPITTRTITVNKERLNTETTPAKNICKSTKWNKNGMSEWNKHGPTPLPIHDVR